MEYSEVRHGQLLVGFRTVTVVDGREKKMVVSSEQISPKFPLNLINNPSF
jgi:hypothetical protein